MTRKLKVLGLALVAVFAMSAMAASAASAQQGYLTADGPVTLDGVEVGEPNENALTAFEGTVRCPGSTYAGHEVNSTPHELIPNGATSVTLTPTYKEPCVSSKGGSEFSTTVEMTSCDYVLNLGETTGGEGTYGVTADVECSVPGDQIHVTQFAGASHGFRVCSITVPQQTGLSGGHVTDEGNGHLLVSGTFTGIKAVESGLCGAKETSEGAFHIRATVSGTDAEGNATAVSISE